MSIVFPTRKTEHWKYTDVSGLLAASFSTGEREKAVEAAKKLSERVRINDAVRLFVVDGFFIEEYSDLKSVPEGVSVQPNAHSLASFDALERHPFVQLNKEKCNGGLCVHIKKRGER